MRKINILDFEQIMMNINPLFKIEIKERKTEPKGSDSRYYAHFIQCNAYVDSSYHGKFGDGKTPIAAIKDYCKELSGHPLVFDPWGGSKLEIKGLKFYYKK